MLNVKAKLSGETMGKVSDAIELLLQLVELMPDAAKHVEQYVSHGELHELQQEIKAAK